MSSVRSKMSTRRWFSSSAWTMAVTSSMPPTRLTTPCSSAGSTTDLRSIHRGESSAWRIWMRRTCSWPGGRSTSAGSAFIPGSRTHSPSDGQRVLAGRAGDLDPPLVDERGPVDRILLEEAGRGREGERLEHLGPGLQLPDEMSLLRHVTEVADDALDLRVVEVVRQDRLEPDPSARTVRNADLDPHDLVRVVDDPPEGAPDGLAVLVRDAQTPIPPDELRRRRIPTTARPPGWHSG